VTDFLPEKDVYPIGDLQGILELFFILQSLPADQRSDGHDRTGQGTTGFSPFGDACGKRTSRLEDFFASHIHFFLQSCKNALRSAKVIHVVLKGQFKDFFKQLFFTHPISSSLCFVPPPHVSTKPIVKDPPNQNRSGLFLSKRFFSRFPTRR
jgi:hypothetical protein